jgi:hypothetical protein
VLIVNVSSSAFGPLVFSIKNTPDPATLSVAGLQQSMN